MQAAAETVAAAVEEYVVVEIEVVVPGPS